VAGHGGGCRVFSGTREDICSEIYGGK
jgi:hypothetical protein